MKLLWPLLGLALLALQPPVSFAQQSGAAKPYVVAVAPGHGGADPGAVFPPDSDRPAVEEKDLTLPIALKLRDRLQSEGVQVVMTRTTDASTTAEGRAALAEKARADVFVAVHVNSWYPDRSVRGAETQYFSDRALADNVADGLAISLRSFQESVRTSKNREEDNILSMPGVIVEAGYLSNSADRDLLQSAGYQQAIADGISEGIVRYAPQIREFKSRAEAPPVVQSQPARSPAAAEQPGQGRFPGWLPPTSAGAAAGLLLLTVRGRRRRRRRIRPRRTQTVVRLR